MADAAAFVAAREALLVRLIAVATADDRIAACWLQGSLADGSADALSDVDAYLAVPDEQFDAVFSERRAIVAQLGRVLFLVDGLVPGLIAVHAILDGPVKLDLIFERLGEAPARQRPAARLLVDKVGLGPQLQLGWEPSLEALARMVNTTYSATRQGGLWPLRLLLRGQWAMYATAELRLINEFLAMMMAVGVYPRLLFKNALTMTRLLRPEQQAELEEMSLAVMQGVAQRDLARLLAAHLRVYDALVREGKAALAVVGMPYPGTDAGDAAQRISYEQHWPNTPPA